MKIARKTVTMLIMTALFCSLLASAAFAAETGSMWVSAERNEGTAALIVADTAVTDGVVKVSYNSELLSYESIEVSQEYVAMYAVNAEEAGVVRISWVGNGNQELEDDAVCLIRLNFTGTAEDPQFVLTGSAHGIDGSVLTFADAPDTTALEVAIAQAQALDASKYTESSYAAAAAALEAAKAVLADGTAVQQEVDEAEQNLLGAILALEKVSTETEESRDPSGDDGNNSSTGDTSMIRIAVAAGILSAAGIITLLLRRQHGKGGYAV